MDPIKRTKICIEHEINPHSHRIFGNDKMVVVYSVSKIEREKIASRLNTKDESASSRIRQMLDGFIDVKLNNLNSYAPTKEFTVPCIKEKTERKVTISVIIEHRQYKALKEMSFKTGISMSALFRECMKSYNVL